MMVLQARDYLDLEGKISATTSLLLRNSKIYEIIPRLRITKIALIFKTSTKIEKIWQKRTKTDEILRENYDEIVWA